jgi:cytochrome c2
MFETYPELAAEHMAGRLAEAEATGAETLLTVCHSCHDVMAGAGGPQPVENLLDIVARSLGIED